MQAVALQQATATVGTGDDSDEDRVETVRLATRRLLSTFLVLEHEEKRTLTQLCAAMAEHALVKATGAQLNGNVMVLFDANAFGETITAPHLRRPTEKLAQALQVSLRGAAPEGARHLGL